MNELISVIVPIYNTENYIEKCIKSLLEQTYENIEIILVDDCSFDSSLEVCKKYASKDKRIKIISLDNNKGVSYARNIGIMNAHGKYICFIDADDWLEKNMIEILYNSIIENNVDISICDYYINTNQKESFHNLLNQKEIINERKKMYDYLFNNNFYGGYLWNKLIKKNLIDKFNIKFDERVKVCEDLLFLSEIFENVKKIVYIPQEKLYHYRCRDGSAVKFSFSEKDMTKLIVLKYFIDKGYIYKNLYYDYFVLNSQSKYIIKKQKLDKKYTKYVNKEEKKYLRKTLKMVDFRKKIKVLTWYFFPIACGKILEKIQNNKNKQ